MRKNLNARGANSEEESHFSSSDPSPLMAEGRYPAKSGVPHPSPLIVAIFLLATILASCGFQLRGQVAIPYKTVFIETTGYSQFANDLERAIRAGSDTKVVRNRDEADAVLKVLSEAQEKRILSLSAGGRVREFELRYTVNYRVVDRTNQDLAIPGTIQLHRDLTYDDTEVLAKESEEILLYKDMKADAVQQMLRRLAVAKPVA